MRETNAIRGARATERDPYRRKFTSPRWTRLVTVLDEPRLMNRLPEFAEFDKARHMEVSREYLELAHAYQDIVAILTDRAFQLYGDHGPLISGCVREHFPDATKDVLRVHNHGASDFASKSLTHWLAAGKHLAMWRVLYFKERFS